jgi:hypothetical protein
MTQKKIPGDRLVLGLLSAFRTLVLELSKKVAIDASEFASFSKRLHQLIERAAIPITWQMLLMRSPSRSRSQSSIQQLDLIEIRKIFLLNGNQRMRGSRCYLLL